MSLSGSNSRLKEYRSRIRSILLDVHSALCISEKDWLEVLELKQRDYRNILSGRKDLPTLNLYCLTERLNLSPEAFQTGRIDYRAIQAHWKGYTDYLSPRYTVGAFSKRHTVLNTLNFLEVTRGREWRQLVNRTFQTNEVLWEKIDQPINILFLTDMWGFLAKQGFSATDFLAIGRNSFSTHQNTHIGKTMGERKNCKDIFEFTFNSFMPQFEQNCFYKIIKLSHDICIIDGWTSTHLSDALKVKHAGNTYSCMVKTGVISSITCFIKRPHARVTETQCVHRGDDKCRFEVEFPTSRVRQL